MKKLIVALFALGLVAGPINDYAQSETTIRQGGAIYDVSTGSFLGHTNINTGKEETLATTIGSGLSATSVVCTTAAKALTSTCSSAAPSFAATTVTTLTATGAVALSPASANVVISPTGTGVVTISPATAGTLDNVAVGGVTPLAGAFTSLTANGAITFTSASASVVANTAGTSQKFIEFANTGHTGFYFGIESSGAGGFFSGSNAYEAILYSPSNAIWVNTPSMRVGGTTNASGGLIRTQATETNATRTIGATDTHIIANRAGTVTLTLGTATAGRELTVRTIQAQTVVSASSNVVPCVGGSAGTAILAATAGKWAVLVGDGSNWQIQLCN